MNPTPQLDATSAGACGDDLRTLEHFRARLHWPVGDARTSDWSGRAAQELRFEVLARIAGGARGLQGCRLLDLGCGQGDLLHWLAAQGVSCNYTGLDLCPELIERARARCSAEQAPRTAFEIGRADEAQRFAARSFDYVLASGLFYLRTRQPERWMSAVLAGAWSWAGRGLAFNCLSRWGSARDTSEYRAEPGEVLALARRASSRMALCHDYHPGDFSVLLWREDAPKRGENACA